jgi:hypothetical protein
VLLVALTLSAGAPATTAATVRPADGRFAGHTSQGLPMILFVVEGTMTEYALIRIRGRVCSGTAFGARPAPIVAARFTLKAGGITVAGRFVEATRIVGTVAWSSSHCRRGQLPVRFVLRWTR